MKANHSQTEAWERAKRMAFWDQGNLEYAKWLPAFKSGKASVIRQSINYMRASDLIALTGRREFIKVWPLLRSADELNENKKAILDGVWGWYVAGDTSFPVYASPVRFHQKKLGTLRVLAKASGNDSIYQIAKMTGRDYRRVYDDIMDFVAEGIATISTETRNGRLSKVPRLYGIHLAMH
jgi:hypothetical protein